MVPNRVIIVLMGTQVQVFSYHLCKVPLNCKQLSNCERNIVRGVGIPYPKILHNIMFTFYDPEDGVFKS